MYELIHGSAHDIPIPDESVHCIVTSPPYYGLRSYSGEQDVEWPVVEYSPLPGLPPITIPGCDPECEHEWTNELRKHPQDRDGQYGGPKQSSNQGAAHVNDGAKTGAYCIHCGGWRGGLGLEPSIEAYIGHLILCLREWHRVLHPSGVCFVNLGDSYQSNNSTQIVDSLRGENGDGTAGLPSRHDALKPKDLMMVPARFALAAQADGWWLRSDIIWAKSNPMPESVTDRPTKAHEYIYLLTKNQRYFYDADAVRENFADERMGNPGNYQNGYSEGAGRNDTSTKGKAWLKGSTGRTSGRNKRTVWAINPGSYKAAHFAAFPPRLVEPMVKAGSSEHGVCPHCLAPWERVVEREGESDWEKRKANGHPMRYGNSENGSAKGFGLKSIPPPVKQTVGWRPTCDCDAGEPVPATILDPFSGSGTTLRVALALGRRAIGVDISKEYLEELTPERIGDVLDELRGELKPIAGSAIDTDGLPLFE